MSVSALKYFWVIRLHPALNLLVLAAVALLGIWMVRLSPRDIDSALGLLLLVQMFLASTGFLPQARRGHFDPVLTASADRARVVMAHAFVSLLPGCVAWTLVVLAAWLWGSSEASSALVGRRALAMLIVSAGAWTAGVPLNRGNSGLLWMSALAFALVRRADLLGTAPVALAAVSYATVARHALVVLLCPFLLFGAGAPLAAGALPAALWVVILGVLCVARSARGFDLRLVDRA